MNTTTATKGLHMYFLADTLEAFMNILAPLWGQQAWVFPDATDRPLFDFERRLHGKQREYFGLGLHVLLSPHVRPSPETEESQRGPRSI